MSIPNLPPISTKYKLNTEKAKDQVEKNIISYHNTGSTSLCYLSTDNHIKEVI